MSCGKHHETDCAEILLKLYEYLDGEMDAQDCERFRRHLDECGPCLREFDRDQLLKSLVRRSCQCEAAPAALRAQIVARISAIRVTAAYVPTQAP